MLKYMLDTNICIFVMKHRTDDLVEKFTIHSDELCISSVTAMELYYGAENSAAPERNFKIINSFISRLALLDYDANAAMQTAQIRVETKRKTIGAYDAMIAGHARSRGLIVVTNNLREFERVDGLRSLDWLTKDGK